MLALGLGPHMVGDFGVNGDGPTGRPVPQEYLAAFRHVRDVSPDYFTLEPLVGLRPDFLFAGWNYGLQTGSDLTPTGLAAYGIKTLALHRVLRPRAKRHLLGHRRRHLPGPRQPGPDLRRGAQGPQTDRLHRRPVAAAGQNRRPRPCPRVRLDSGQSAPVTAPGLAMPNALMSLGGGTNIFSGLSRAGPRSPGSRSSRPTPSASSSTTTAPRPPPRRRSSFRPARPPGTSPRSRTTAS